MSTAPGGEIGQDYVPGSGHASGHGPGAASVAELAPHGVACGHLPTQDTSRDRERLELVLASSDLGLWDWNMVTGEVVFDQRWAQIVGYRLEELEPVSIDTWIGLAHPDDLAASNAAIEAHATGRAPFYDVEARMRHREGHWVTVRDRGRIVEWTPEGDPLRMTGTHEDITALVAARNELQRSRAQLAQAARLADVGYWTLDVQTGHVTWSPELFQMLGLAMDGPPPDYSEHRQLFSPQSWEKLDAALARTSETGDPYELELQTVRPDGTHGWMLARGEAVHDNVGRIVGLQGVALDITERKNWADQLHDMATHDPLTGLANRAALMDEIPQALVAARRSGHATGVLLADLDGFKVVNDSLGHDAGDALLVGAAERILKVVRGADLTARLGGDEFVVVMRELEDPRDAVVAAERLLEAFESPLATRGTEFRCTASIGVALGSPTSTAEDLLREADTAMYAAKNDGRNRVCVFNEELRTTLTARLDVETALRRACGSDELELYYQPEIDLATGRVTAVEALLRWNHPDGDLRTAAQFIEVAEDSGLILEIGEWVLHQSCRQAALWNSNGRKTGTQVRVNLSALQLSEPGLLTVIDSALAQSGLDPTTLCLEVTETALLHHTATVRTNLDGIRSRGVAIALDDFGTGYASLTHLSSFPVDAIKIDRSFMSVPGASDHSDKLLAGIVALARALEIGVVAEGVEHAEQEVELRRLGCHSAQGWLYAPALPVSEVERLLPIVFAPGGVAAP